MVSGRPRRSITFQRKGNDPLLRDHRIHPCMAQQSSTIVVPPAQARRADLAADSLAAPRRGPTGKPPPLSSSPHFLCGRGCTLSRRTPCLRHGSPKARGELRLMSCMDSAAGRAPSPFHMGCLCIQGHDDGVVLCHLRPNDHRTQDSLCDSLPWQISHVFNLCKARRM